jgi:hypothetical protein
MAIALPPAGTEVIDLVAIAQACQPVIAWYDDFLARPQAGLAAKRLARLDIALTALRSLPRCGGRIGRAMAVVASGGAASSTERTLAALETLRTTLSMCPASARVASAGTPPAPPAVQPTLPGFEASAIERADGIDRPPDRPPTGDSAT